MPSVNTRQNTAMKFKLLSLTAAAFAVFAALPASASESSADKGLLIHNARGLTLDARGAVQRFEALAIDMQGRVLATGSIKTLQPLLPHAQQIDARGQVLMPGLADAHGHVMGLGLSRRRLELRDTADLPAALAAIKAYAEARPAATWIRGRGWNQANWKLGRFPTASELDSAVEQRPVWLERVDGHAGWANSRALALAGITRDTPDPKGGSIERDASGIPNGILVDAAMDLVSHLVPPTDEAELRAALLTAQTELLSLGFTSVHDAGVASKTDALVRELAAAGELKIRIEGMFSGGDPAMTRRMLAEGPYTGKDGLYNLRAVKLFADGALGSRGAALIDPYSDSPHSHGLLFQTDAQLHAQMLAAAAAGFQVNVHAIGDAGNRQVLAGFEQIRHELGTAKAKALRHRIEHAQVLALADIARLARADVIASIQPVHATSDMNMAEDRVGPQRIQGAYAWQRLLTSGARLACGSDFPVEEPTPWAGLYAAVTRQGADGLPVGGWYGKQALSRVQALDCFTRGAAYAAHREREIGSLLKGMQADFILLDIDPLTASPQDLLHAKVAQTWVGGRLVYKREL